GRRRRAGGRHAEDLDVRDHVADARRRLFGPVDASLDLRHAASERVLALVEPVDVEALAGELALGVVVGYVAAHRHPVTRVVGEEREPLVEAAGVEELRLGVEKLFDLPLEQEPPQGRVAHDGISPAQLTASMHWRQRVENPRWLCSLALACVTSLIAPGSLRPWSSKSRVARPRPIS